RLPASRGLVGAPGFGAGKSGQDAAAVHREAVIVEDRACRLDRDDPARADEQIDSYRAVPLREMIARRFGARHAISSLRSLLSGQNFAGTVLPIPMVSTLSGATPLAT